MKTQVTQKRNTTLAIYILTITVFMLSFTAVAAAQYL